MKRPAGKIHFSLLLILTVLCGLAPFLAPGWRDALAQVYSPQVNIEKVEGQDSQSIGLGVNISLAVRVTDENAQPIVGTIVNWNRKVLSDVDGGAFVDPPGSTTDSSGVARTTFRTDNQPSAPARYQVDAVASSKAGSASESFTINVGVEGVVRANSPEAAGARAVDDVCPQLVTMLVGDLTGPQTALLDNCTNIIVASTGGPSADVNTATRQISPEEMQTQNRISIDFAGAQLGNLGARLGALRRASRSDVLSGLAFNIDGQTLPGELLAGLLPLSGGSAGEATFGRLGVFVNGTVNVGDRDRTSNEEGFDFDTYGVTLGADYRLTDTAILGLAFGYGNTDVDLDSDGGEVDADSYSFSAYGSYFASEALFFEGIFSYGMNDFDISRNIRYVLAGLDSVNTTASGDTESDQFSFSLGGGYQFNLGNGISAILDGRINYLDGEIDGYTERGGAVDEGLNLQLRGQDLESLTLTLGGDVSRAMSMNWGILVPRLRFEWEHEFEDDAETVAFRFANAPSATFFEFETDEPDEDYFRLGVGLNAILPHGRSAFIYYENVLGQDDFSSHNITAGLRLEF